MSAHKALRRDPGFKANVLSQRFGDAAQDSPVALEMAQGYRDAVAGREPDMLAISPSQKRDKGIEPYLMAYEAGLTGQPMKTITGEQIGEAIARIGKLRAAPEPAPAPKRPPKASTVPLAQSIRRMGGVATTRANGATGERTPTFMAQELAHRGITPRTHPYLFNQRGGADFDNISPGTFGPDDAQVFGLDDTGNYLNRDAILDRLASEVTGGEPTSFDMAEGMDRRDVEHSEADQDRARAIEEDVDGSITDMSLRLLPGEREAIIKMVQQGEPVDESIYAVLERAAIAQEGADGRGEERAAADGAEFADLGEVPFGDEPLSGNRQADPRPADGSRAPQEERGEAGGGGQGRQDDQQVSGASQEGVTTERTDAGEQGVIPGAERSADQARQQLTDRQRLEMEARQKQSKMRRLGGNGGDAGPLFDTQGDLLSATQAQAKAEPQPKQRTTKIERERAAVLDRLEAFFAPGNVVPGFGGNDRVIRFKREEGGDWSVSVRSVVKRDGEWVDVLDARTRTHRTAPTERELRAGPVLTAEAATPSTANTGLNGEVITEADDAEARRQAAIASGFELTAAPVPERALWWTNGTAALRDSVTKAAGPAAAREVARVKGWESLSEKTRRALLDAFGRLYRDGSVNNIGTIESPRYEVSALTAEAAPAVAETVTEAAAQTDPNPSPAQAEAENYRTGKAQWNGLTLSIENAKGSVRRKVGPNGAEWSVTMPAHYGRVLRTEGADGDHVDFYMGPNEASDFVVIVNQIDPETGAFDEHKAVLGTGSRAEALRIYEAGFSDGSGRSRIGSDTATTVDGFKAWLADGDMKKPTQPVKAAPKGASKPAQTSPKITDFGEKIGGAAKDLWTSFADRLSEAEGFDVAKEPLSKTWPEPSYEKLIEAGTDPWSVAFVRAARESLPRKPAKAWKLEQWAKQVTTLRDFARGVLAGEFSRADLEPRLAGNRSLQKMAGSIALYEAVGHAKTLKDFTLSKNTYSIIAGERYSGGGKSFWEVSKEAKATAFRNMPRTLVREDTQEAAIEKFKALHASLAENGDTKGQSKADKRSKFILWSLRGKADQGYFVGTKIGSNHIELRSGVKTVKEARRIIAEEADQLQAQLDRMRDIPNERRDENAPRVGSDHRGGADVTPEAFMEAFGFRGVEFGNYVEGPRRQQDLNDAYDALHDLAGIVDIPTKALSLNGSLALAFGARGKGGKNAAAAHYEPGKVVINLTKSQGRGSLAHEWFHAIDNYFAKAREEQRGGYITDSTAAPERVPGVRPEVMRAFGAVRRAINETDLKTRSQNLDKLRSKPYWGTGIEMHARAFESYVIAKLQDQGGANDYLANVVNGTLWSMLAEASGLGDSYPYLKPREMEKVRPAFDALFETIETRETDSGVEMFSRAPAGLSEIEADPETTAEDMQAVARDVSAEMRQHGLQDKVKVEVVRQLHQRAHGSYTRTTGRIRVKAESDLDSIGVLRHEIIHALRDSTLWGRPYGLFTQAEWQGLVRAGRADKALTAQVEERYPDLGSSGRAEEVVAEMYRKWALNRDQRSGVGAAFEKIRAFFSALGNALRGQGFQSAALTMERIAAGGVGARGPEGNAAREAARSRFGDEPGVAESRGEEVTKTPAFKRWFGKSKVVDTKGDPMVVYHGTNADFEAFDATRAGQRWGVDGEFGIFFTGSAGEASDFASRDGRESANAAVVPVYLSLQSPLGWRDVMFYEGWGDDAYTATEAQVEAFAREEMSGRSMVGYFEMLKPADWAERVQDGNFDGIALSDPDSSANALFVALRPEQIKSAIGNRGTFDPDDQRIAYSRFAPRRPDGRFASKAAEYSAKILGGGAITGERERGLLGQMLTDAMGGKSSRYNILALVPGEPLYQELAKNLPSARTYLRLKHDMGAMRNQMQAEAAKLMDEWRGFLVRDRKSNEALMDLMHDATIAGLDPAAPFTTRKKRTGETQADFDVFVEMRRQGYAELKARWDKLPGKAQEVYRKVRDSYVEVAKTEREIIEQNIRDAMDINLKRARLAYEDELNRIDEDGLEGAEREEAEEAAAGTYNAVKKRDGYGRNARLRSLRLMMEQNQVEAPYFPLMRQGQYFVTVKDAKGAIVSFTKVKTERQQTRIAAEARKDFPDHKVITGLMGSQDAAPDVDPIFVADVEELIGSKVDDPELMDAIWQRYLESLPDFSMRKSRLHRKGTPGFAKDAFRNFAQQMFHSAHQLARLKHSMPMQMALEDAQREARKADDPNRAGAVANEMTLRHDWIMNPQSSAWSTWATGAAFVYYLGMTPAAALVNLSQTAIVGIPVLAAGFKKGGVVRASRELMRAMREFTAGRGAVDKAKSLTAEEREAMGAAYDRGIVDKSQAHDLAGVAESGVEYSDIRHRIMTPISFFFHHAERLNREITFLAAYRMARADGIEHQTAIDKAGELTWKTHFNYESDSRPRIQQNDFMRVLTVFRNFQLNMIYRLFRDMHQAFKGRTADERKEARAQLFGITGMMMMSAGVTGTWGYGLMMTLAGMFAPGADSDDLEKELRNGLVNTLGRDLAGMILNGVPGHLTGIDLTSRLGMPELWFRAPDRQLEGDDLYTYWAQQFLGAIPGMAQNAFRGVDLAAGGDIWRGMETASPKFIRDLMRGWRYSQDGVTTISGNPLLEALSPGDALMQAAGFTPAQVAERYDINRWMMNQNSEVQQSRSGLLTDVWRDARDGEEISASTRRRIEDFNRENPDYRIDGDAIRRSMQSRRRAIQQTVGGVRLNARIDARVRASAPVSIYGENQ